MCVVNFLPSVDNYWVLGNAIYKDYYVYHNPQSGVMGWVPTTQKFKQPLKKDTIPTKSIEYGYDYEQAYIKAIVWLGTVVASAAAA